MLFIIDEAESIDDAVWDKLGESLRCDGQQQESVVWRSWEPVKDAILHD